MKARALIAACAVALLAFPLLSDSLYYQNMIILSLVFAIGAVGLNVISGYGGYISLGQGAFLGLGAYTLAILSTRVDVSVWIWVPVAGVVAGLFAAGLGAIALLLVYEHAIVKADDLGRVNRAFFHVNAVVSVGVCAGVIVDLMARR